MRITEPWDPLGNYFVKDLVDDLFDESQRRAPMKCEICALGPEQGVTLYRQNPFGEKGIWRCWRDTKVTVDPETKRLVDVLESTDEDR